MHYFEVWKSVFSSYFPGWIVFPVGSSIIIVASVSVNVSTTSHTRLLISIVALVLIWNMEMIVVPVVLGAVERVLTS